MLRKLEPPLCLPFLIKGLTNRVWFACAQIFAEYPCVDKLESRLRLCIFFTGAIYRHVHGKLLSSSKSGKLLLVLKNKLGDLYQSETDK